MATQSRSKYYNVTVDGISVKVPKDAMDDMEVVEMFGELQDGNIFVFPKLAKTLFGDEYQKVMNALAGSDGRTKVSDASDFFIKVLNACNAIAAKN